MAPTLKGWAAADGAQEEELEEVLEAEPENPRDRDVPDPPLPIVRVGNVSRHPAKFGKLSGKASTKGPGKVGGRGARGSARAGAKGWAKGGKAKGTDQR